MIGRIRIIGAIWLIASSVRAAGVPDDCKQLIIAVAPGWNSTHGRARLFENEAGNWRTSGESFSVLFGRNGLAWGSGIAGQDENGLRKKERDGRAPAGIFHIGKIYTYDAHLPVGADYPFHQVTKSDAWVDDMRSSHYNQFVTIDDPANPPDWFEKQKMRHNDFAYRWLLEIRHNSDPPVPGNGSAIFFHIRRGVNRPSAGCTTMAEADLLRVITWLRAPRDPCFALLPNDVYREKWPDWKLPAPEITGFWP